MAQNASDQSQSASLTGWIIGIIDGAWAIFSAEVMRHRHPVAATANRTLLPGECGAVCTNRGATGQVIFQLPAATPGLHWSFTGAAAQILRIEPNGADTIQRPDTGADAGAGKYIQATAANALLARCSLACVTAGKWSVIASQGTWAVEP